VQLRALLAASCLAAAAFGMPAALAAPARLAPQPGDAISVTDGGGCTLGFLFKGSDGASYASTAGHCTLNTTIPGDQRRTWPTGKGPVVALTGNPDGSSTATGAIGRVVFAEFVQSPSQDDWYDFSLIRLDRGVTPNPRVRGVGGPTYIDDQRTDSPTILYFYGQGDVFGTVQPQRQLVANTMHDPDHVYANGAAIFGDSGAPVVDGDGGAVGLILGAGGNSIGVGVGSVDMGHDEAVNRILRLKPVLAQAAAALHLTLKLHRT
jgi:hypothetical protein